MRQRPLEREQIKRRIAGSARDERRVMTLENYAAVRRSFDFAQIKRRVRVPDVHPIGISASNPEVLPREMNGAR